jgi:hypothetical protein
MEEVTIMENIKSIFSWILFVIIVGVIAAYFAGVSPSKIASVFHGHGGHHGGHHGGGGHGGEVYKVTYNTNTVAKKAKSLVNYSHEKSPEGPEERSKSFWWLDTSVLGDMSLWGSLDTCLDPKTNEKVPCEPDGETTLCYDSMNRKIDCKYVDNYSQEL